MLCNRWGKGPRAARPRGEKHEKQWRIKLTGRKP